MTAIKYKGFSEDNTKAGKLRDAQIEALLCIFEESITKCNQDNISEIKFKTSQFEKLTKFIKLPNFDIHIEKKDFAKSIIWVGTFKTKKRKFMIFAEANNE